MAPQITCQTILVPATPTTEVRQSLLVFADDELVAVVMPLQNEDRGGRWILEKGYGPCTVAPGADVQFQGPDEAQHWVLERVSRAREAAAHAAMMARPVP